FWEVSIDGIHWAPYIQNVDSTCLFGGRTDVLRWEGAKGSLHASPSAHNFPSKVMNGREILGRDGVRITQMGQKSCTLYLGELFGKSAATVVPHRHEDLPAIWCFCTSEGYRDLVSQVDAKLNVTNASLAKVPFDLKHWQKVAAEKYPSGLPDPESNDPTQWLFHGRPEHSNAPLQVAVARLLGYRWPAELDSEMRLSQRSRELVDRCSELDELVDDDGVVCIPSVRGEDPASDRLLRLLHATGVNHGENLEIWLRDKFFQEHCELFHQRPFIWHIWDGKKDGFAALVNYHKLAGPHGKKLLESLAYSYLGDWITRQEAAVKNNESGADDRLLAAKELQEKLEAIVHGEPPYDIFVRWKPLHEQPIGWTPDINDGVRINIRPFMLAELSRGRKGAGVLRFPPKVKWTKDRGKEPKRPPEDFPWFWSWDEKKDDPTDFAGGDTFTGERWNDLHYTNAFKQKACEAAKKREVES
ncbi:MAG: SAM-dependent DNA methyltransferase, partial [Bacteroidota bacterium]